VKTKFLRIGFYKVTVEHDVPIRFDEILQRFQDDIPADVRRTLEPRDSPLRLQWIRQVRGVWAGEMLRIRMHEDLRKASKNGNEEPIQFAPDEGLGENTAFLFHAATRTLAIHEQRGAVPVSALPHYFKTFGEVRDITFEPMIKPQAMERVRRMPSIYSFDIHLAGIDRADHLDTAGRSAGAVLDMLQVFRAPKASIHIEMPKRRGRHEDRGTLRNVRDAVSGFLRLNRNDQNAVTKLIVIGADPDGQREEAAIDLLEDRLVELVPVPLNEGERLTEAHRHDAVRTAWNTHQQGIEQFYGPAAE